MTHPGSDQKPVDFVPIAPPPPEQRVRRLARFATPGEKRTRYTLPDSLQSASPIGYRHRVSFTRAEAEELMPLFSLPRPTGFGVPHSVSEGELFEESSLGVLSARQSTNFRGQKQVTVGPEDSRKVAALLREMGGLDAPVLEGACHTHLIFSRPYRTAFTLLLTFVGHGKLTSPFGVAARALRKRYFFKDDIPSIGSLQQLHVGILADSLDRAALVASEGRRRAQVFLKPFTGKADKRVVRRLEQLADLSDSDRGLGWRLAIVAQVGAALPGEGLDLPRTLWRKLGANLLSLRSERIQPGVNADESASSEYKKRQDMDVSDEFTRMVGRAAYNAFCHWTGVGRDAAKDLLLLERIDVLSQKGKERLRQVRHELNHITDLILRKLPTWADVLTLKALSRNVERGRKAFALAGQRIYLGGLSRKEVERQGLEWEHALRAVGAAGARSSLFAELAGCVDIPQGCDLLGGMCLMAGPVNQNDIGKTFFGMQDLLSEAYPQQDPTTLLVWTLKAKTVADPIGNEEQLLNPARKGAIVDLRPGPHEICALRIDGRTRAMRAHKGTVNQERAFGDVGNFVRDASGRGIDGNEGCVWPAALRDAPIWG